MLLICIVMVLYFVLTGFITGYYSYPSFMIFEYGMCLVLGSSLAFIFVKKNISIIRKILMILISGAFIFNALFDEFKHRKMLGGEIPLLAIANNKEFIINPLDGYYAVSYKFNFQDFESKSKCNNKNVASIMAEDVLSKYNGPKNILNDLNTIMNICVTEEIKNDKGSILIYHENGIVLMIFL